jgi:hypothetical protein
MFKLFKNERALCFANENGVIPLPLMVAVVGVILFLIIASFFSFGKNNIFSKLFPKQFSGAAGIVDLSMSPAQATVPQNGTFNVSVAINAKTAEVSATAVQVNYDPAFLQATAITNGTFLPVVLIPGAVSSGTASITLGANPGSPQSGSGTLATVTFKALQTTAATTSVISFDTSNTQVAAIGQTGNQVGSLTSSSIIVGQASSGTASFSLSPPASSTAGGVEFPVQVMVQTDTDNSNVFAAKLNFDATKMQVSRIDTTGTFIANWADNFFDNSAGKVSLIGGVPNPGFKTSGAPVLMATVYFIGYVAGVTPISFDGTTAIFRNSDNTNIFNIATGASETITSSAPTPSPSPTGSATPNPSGTASPTPSPSPIACSITSASWSNASSPVTQGTLVSLTVNATGSCSGQQVSFVVSQDNGLLTPGTVSTNPPNATFNGSGVAQSSWVAEYQQDGPGGLFDPPEYYFVATVISNNSNMRSGNPELQVNKLNPGTFAAGDINHDGKVDLQDLSVLLSNWNKDRAVDLDFPNPADLNSDGKINTFDFSTLVVILKTVGIVSGP